jgi:hypothetical protein
MISKCSMVLQDAVARAHTSSLVVIKATGDVAARD